MKNFRFESEVKKNGLRDEKLIWAKNSEGLNEYCFFRKTFMCDKMPKTAVLNIFVQSKYRLFINGESVIRYDAGISENGEMSVIDVLPFLKQGKNVIAIFACYYSYPTENIDLRQKGVIFNLCLDYSGARQENVISDASVKSMICNAYLKDAPYIRKDKGIIEVFDNSIYNSDWMLADFDDFDWDYSEETNLCDTRYFDILKSSYNPPSEHVYSAKAIIAAGTGNDKKGLSLKEILYHENMPCELNKLYVAGVECELQPIDKGQYSYILVDFDRVCNGYLKMDVTGYGGDTVDVLFAKELDGGKPVISGAARFVLKAENNILETNFDKNEFRYAFLVFRNPVRTNNLNGLWAVECEYPFENTSEFSCDDKNLNSCFEECISKIKSSFSNQILGEGVFEKRILAVSNAYLSGDVTHFKNMLTDIKSMQLENGQLINQRADKCFDFYDICSYALAIKDYYVLSGDKKTTSSLLESIINAFRWISSYEQDGFLIPVLTGDKPKSETLLNAFYIWSIEALASVATYCWDLQAKIYFESKANKLKKSYLATFAENQDEFIENNKNEIYDICSLLILIGMQDFVKEVLSKLEDCEVKTIMPLEFIRAMKKSGKSDMAYQSIVSGVIDLRVVPVFVAESILGADLMNKKGIKLNVDTESFGNINTKIFSPRGVLEFHAEKSAEISQEPVDLTDSGEQI